VDERNRNTNREGNFRARPKKFDKTRLFDLLERYLNEITPRKRGRDVEKCRIQTLKSYSIISKQINKQNN
tara:strand:+ start:658 stop:867 length:210 start_codon:yes stop_codon:yes gene_type:complete